MYEILILAVVALVYIFLGTLFGMFLFLRYQDFYDEAGAFCCGALWPITLPIIFTIAAALLLIRLIAACASPQKGWRKK